MEAKRKGVIDVAIEKMTELDAAGRAIVLLRCDRETDIRRTVEGYVHANRYAPKVKTADWQHKQASMPVENMKEVTAMGTVKRYGAPFSWQEHAPRSDDANALDHGTEPALMEYLGRCVIPATALQHRLIYFSQFYDVVGKPETVRTAVQQQYISLLREISVLKRRGRSNALIVLGCTDGMLCEELREHIYVMDIDYPEREELLDIIYDACQQCAGKASGLEPAVANDLAEVLRGMREEDVRNIINLAYAQCENPLESRAKNLFAAAKDAKRQRIAGIRGLSWIDNDKPLDVGGFGALKKWLDNKKMTFLYPHAAKRQWAKAPKGMLLVGLPGCGKTHLAKQTARMLSDGKGTVPLLQMDLNSMLGKWLGEAEGNCAMALRAVESVAPAVLLVDEIEKVFGGVTDGGANDAMMHIFGTFLDWMQREREKPILVIATANKTDRLPPELKRKGRFDETFFSGVPMRKDCETILRIHLKRKKDVLETKGDGDRELEDFCNDVTREFFNCAARIRRFVNGADIETIVDSAFCSLFADYAKANLSREDEIDIDVKRYTADEVKRALERELRDTRSYFDNNMQNTAQYWIEMARLHFRDSGDSQLLDDEQFVAETGMFKSLNLPLDQERYGQEALKNAETRGNQGNYDEALRYTLAAEIHKQVQEKGGKG